MTWLVYVSAFIIWILTLRHVYDGGKTLNDHLVGVFVGMCILVYPILWHGFWVELNCHWGFGLLFLIPVIGIYSLFAILVRRRDAANLMPLAILSQFAYSFSIWTWPIILVFFPMAVFLEDFSIWPGWWLLISIFLSIWGTTWTYLRNEQISSISIGQNGIRLVQLSDIHVSPVMRRSDMQRLIAKVNALKPDIVAITGDFVMPFSEKEHDFLLETLALLNAPCFCCMGNHDLPIAETLKTELEAISVRMLVDQHVQVDISGVSIDIVGLDFHWMDARNKSTQALHEIGKLDGDFQLLLIHDPRYFTWLQDESFDLVLAGHTHGGQIGFNMFGLPISVLRLLGFYDQGLFHAKGSMLYVHKGNWHTGLPPRMGIATEIAVFDL